jgi:uncharacterized protein YicC (UPF0701 family)
VPRSRPAVTAKGGVSPAAGFRAAVSGALPRTERIEEVTFGLRLQIVERKAPDCRDRSSHLSQVVRAALTEVDVLLEARALRGRQPTFEVARHEFHELVTRYFDGALSDLERTRFEEHVVICDGCSNHLHQMRTTVRVVGRLEETDLDDETSTVLLAAFRGWKGG